MKSALQSWDRLIEVYTYQSPRFISSDQRIQLAEDTEVVEGVKAGMKEFHFERDSCCFSADVFAKIEKQ